MIHFLKITVQSKGTDDFRSFLDFADSEEMMVYQIRAQGATPTEAVDQVWKYFNSEDRDFFIEDSWEWV